MKKFASRNHTHVVTWLRRKGLSLQNHAWRDSTGNVCGALHYASGVWYGSSLKGL